jgi:HTH-type transcriptional regulator, competence development regulator
MSQEGDEVPRSLGEELHKVRQLRGMSLKAVAEPAGVSATYLQKLERGEVKSPSPHRLRRLADVLEVEYAALFALAGYSDSSDVSAAVARRGPGLAVPSTAKGSLLRQAFQSEEHVTDEELEQLAQYLQFLRQLRGEKAP